MTGHELWLEVMGVKTAAEVIEVARDAGETVKDTVAVNVQEHINLCGVPEGETAQSITAKLMQFIADSTQDAQPWPRSPFRGTGHRPG